MSDSEVFLYFTLPSRDYVAAKTLIGDADLRGQQNLFEDCTGGLAIEGPGGPIFVDDDFEHVEAQLLNAAPGQLEVGESFGFDYRYEDGARLEINVAGDEVTFDDGEGSEVTMPRAEAIAGLRRAAEELARLRELAG